MGGQRRLRFYGYFGMMEEFLPMEKQKTTVRVAGKDYTLVSSDSAEYMTRVAAYVDRKISEIALAARLPVDKAAVLVALNIADELMKSHDENSRLRRELTLQRGHSAPSGHPGPKEAFSLPLETHRQRALPSGLLPGRCPGPAKGLRAFRNPSADGGGAGDMQGSWRRVFDPFHQMRRDAGPAAAQGIERNRNNQVIWQGMRRFPKGDRKALWSPPQRRNPAPRHRVAPHPPCGVTPALKRPSNLLPERGSKG